MWAGPAEAIRSSSMLTQAAHAYVQKAPLQAHALKQGMTEGPQRIWTPEEIPAWLSALPWKGAVVGIGIAKAGAAV